MFKKSLFISLFCIVLISSAVFAAAQGEFEGEDGQFIGNAIYKLGFKSFAEEKLAYLRHVNMGGKCTYYEGDTACTLEGGSFLLPGGEDLYSWHYYDEIVAAMVPYNDALAQLRLERQQAADACESMYTTCYENVKNEYDYGKIYDKEAEQYKARKSFFKTINEQISKRYLTGEREAGALQSIEVAFSGYNSCMDTCDVPFGASKKSSSYCDDICMAKYQETLMKDFAKYRKEELTLLESQAAAKTDPLYGAIPGVDTPLETDQDGQSQISDSDGTDISSLNDGRPSGTGSSKVGIVFAVSMYLATGILMWYLIFKFVINRIRKLRK